MPCVLALHLLVQAGANFFILFTPGTWYSVGPRLSFVLAGGEQPLCKPSSGAYVTALGAIWKVSLLREDLFSEPRASLPVFSRRKRQRWEQECSRGHTCGVGTALALYQRSTLRQPVNLREKHPCLVTSGESFVVKASPREPEAVQQLTGAGERKRCRQAGMRCRRGVGFPVSAFIEVPQLCRLATGN